MKMSMIQKLEELANKQGSTIYNICYRKAGWAIQWYEVFQSDKASLGESENWRNFLIVYQYYPTLEEAVRMEHKRLSAEEKKKNLG